MKRFAMSMVGLAAFSMVATTAITPAVAKDATVTKTTDAWGTVSGLLPGNVVAVVGISATKLKSLQIFQDFYKSVSAEQNVQMALGMVQNACGFDPIAALENVVVAVDDKDQVAVFVQATGVDEAKVTACVTTMLKQMQGKDITAKKTGNLVEYSMAGEQEKFYVAWPTKNVFMISSEPTDKTITQSFLKGKGKLLKDANFKAGLALVKTAGLVWLVGTKIDDNDLKAAKAKFAAGTIDSDNGTDITVDGRLRVADAATAKKVAEMAAQEFAQGLKELPGSVGTLLSGIKIAASDKDVTVSGSVKLDKAAAKLLGDLVKQGM